MPRGPKLVQPCGVKGCANKISERNKSGVCPTCLRRRFTKGDTWRAPAARAARAPGAAADTRAAAEAQPFDPTLLSDEDLAACVREARERRTRIEREAAERVRQLDEALRTVAPVAVERETGT